MKTDKIKKDVFFMLCKNCTAELANDAKFCPECGAKVEVEAPVVAEAPVIEAAPVSYGMPKKEITAEDLPEQFKPMSPWAYFGLSILYSVPVVGFIFLMIFTFNGGNINRRNFTRSYWCGAIIVLAIFVVVLIIALALGGFSALTRSIDSTLPALR